MLNLKNKPTEAEFKIYPSGFLGSNTVPTTKPMDLEKIKSELFNLSNVNNPDAHTANMSVVRLWGRVTYGDKDFNKFEFKEEILKTALSSFGTFKIIDWLKIQSESPYFGQMHSDWIDETLHFVFTGKIRHMTFHNWTVLLQMVDGAKLSSMSPAVKFYFYGDSTSEVERKMIKSNIDLKYKNAFNPNMTLAEFFHCWCKQPDGINDLMYSLHVLFGER